MAKIISFADQGYNLSLIDPNNNPPDHLRSFWIAAFRKLLNSNTLLQSHELPYGYHCRFPFSRHIQHAIQALIKGYQANKSG